MKSVLRFCGALACILLATYVIRLLAPNIYLNNLGYAAAYILILKATYNYKWKNLIISVLLCNSTLIVIEDLYIPYVLIYMGADIAQLAKNIAVLFYLSLPARFTQMLIIAFLRKFNFLIDFAKARKYFYPLAYILIVSNLAVDVLSNLCANYYKVMKLQDFMVFAVVIYVLVGLYYSIPILVDKVSSMVVGFYFYKCISLKEEYESILTRIEKLIDENDMVSAKKFIVTIREVEFGGDGENGEGGEGD